MGFKNAMISKRFRKFRKFLGNKFDVNRFKIALNCKILKTLDPTRF